MLKYKNNDILEAFFNNADIIKMYKGTTLCFYKVGGGSPSPTGQTPCFAVVEDISDYEDTEFVDVYDKATSKWYKKNNLSEYEEYGVYGDGRNITYYEGKLTVDDGYEYVHSGSSWVNLGEVSGSSIVIKSPEYLTRNSSYNGYLSLVETLTQDTKIIMKHRQTSAGGGAIIGDYFNTDNDDWRVFFYGNTIYYDFNTQRRNTSKSMPMSSAEEWEIGNYYIKNTANGNNLLTGATQTFSTRPNEMYLYHLGGYGNVTDYGEIYYVKIYQGQTLVRDFIPWTDMNGNYGLYDKVNGTTVQSVGNLTASTTINDVEVGGGGVEYPQYYTEKQDPPTSVTFNTMADALAYQCPYVGLQATIGGVSYVFNENYEWEEIVLVSAITGLTTSSSSFNMRINNSYVAATITSDNGDGTYNYEVEYTSAITATTNMLSQSTSYQHTGNTNILSLDWNGVDVSSLTTLGDYSFDSCTNLSAITIPSAVTTINQYAFYMCSGLTSITIPDSVTTIKKASFRNGGVTTLLIGNGVTSIGNFAFYICPNLKTVTITATTPPTAGSNMFQNAHSSLVIYVPSASVDTYKAASGWSTYASKIQPIP